MIRRLHLLVPAMVLLVCQSACAGVDSNPIWYDARVLADMATLGSRAAERVVGPGWKTSAEPIHSLVGWDGSVYGEAIRFTSNRLSVNDSPATFRIIRTNWPPPSLRPDAGPDSDVAFSWGSGFWFYSPGNYAAAYPKHWKKVLGSLCAVFGLPPATAGLVCHLECGRLSGPVNLLERGDALVPAGDPLPLFYASLVKLRGAKRPSPTEYCEDCARFLVVTDPNGRQLTPKKRFGPPRWQRATDRWDQIYLGSLDLGATYDLSKPGDYRVKLRCPLDKKGIRKAESQEISVRIVPADYLTVRLNKLFDDKPLSSGASLPVELELNVKKGGLEQFSELSIAFAAVRTQPEEPRLELYGWGREMLEDLLGSLRSAGRGRFRATLDLAAGKWNSSVSTIGPIDDPIWSFLKAGEEWRISVSITGKTGGRAFRLRCNDLTLRVAGDRAP